MKLKLYKFLIISPHVVSQAFGFNLVFKTKKASKRKTLKKYEDSQEQFAAT